MPSVSILLLAHNVAERIESVIEQWAPQCEELVVVDNKSLDSTSTIASEVAKRYGNVFLLTIRCEEREADRNWRPLAAARNTALSFVSSDWVLVLDDDEYVSDEGLNVLRNLAEGTEHVGFFLPWNTYESDGKLRVEDYKLSFFRAKRGVCYEGLIHENPTVSIRKAGGTCDFARVELRHLPTEGAVQQKRATYSMALRSAVGLRPYCARTRWFLGLTCYKLDLFEEAGEHLVACAQMEEDVWHPIERINASFLLGWSELRVGKRREGRRWLIKALRLCSTHSGDPEMVAYGKVLAAIQHVFDAANDSRAINAIDPTRLFYCF